MLQMAPQYLTLFSQWMQIQIPYPVEGKPDVYLGGLLWNLQTYQDGVCPDYSFNYGKRLAPTARDIVHFLKEAQENHTELGLVQLMPNSTTSAPETFPISAGVSCLAALPSQVRDLVPEPYRSLDTETVEEFYGECMDRNDNVFDIKKFERLCNEKVAELGYAHGKGPLVAQGDEEKSMENSHYWILLSKSRQPLTNPIDPPPPFSDRLTALRPNDRIRVRRVRATWRLRQRDVWGADQIHDSNEKLTKEYKGEKWEQKMLNQAKADRFLAKFKSLDDVNYKQAYQKKGGQEDKKTISPIEAFLNGPTEEPKKKTRKPVGVAERMLTFEMKPPPKKYATTKDGQSAIACLKQLQDAELIGSFEWKSTVPSPSAYASFSPEEHELVSLIVPVSSNAEKNVLQGPLAYEQDRVINHVSKQAMKQHLATFALCDIVGPGVRWSDLTFKELKDLVLEKIIIMPRTAGEQ
jgi:hypothetical protein